MRTRRWWSVLAVVALAAAIAVTTTALARTDRERVPVWVLHDGATSRDVQRLADALGIPGTVERRARSWRVREGGVELEVSRLPGTPWRAGPAGAPGELRGPADADHDDAIRIAEELVRGVGGPAVEVVSGEAGQVVLRPTTAWGPVSAMPWRVSVDATGRVLAAGGWLGRPTPGWATPAELRATATLLPRRVPGQQAP